MTAFYRFEKLLLILVLLETFLGGNGYLLHVGGIRLRVLLAIICLGWVLLRLLIIDPATLPTAVWGLVFAFVATTALGTVIGLDNHAQFGDIKAEIKPLMYFMLILFFAVAIRNREQVDLVSNLIVYCGVFQAFVYLALLSSAHLGMVSHHSIYLFLRESDEFIFRHDPESRYFLGFFYKGTFHMCTAALFLLFDPVRKNRFLALLVLAAIVLTLTRGLLAALIVTLIIGVLLAPKKHTLTLFVLAAMAALLVLISTNLIELILRPDSDSVRIADLRFVWGELDWSMLLHGRGIGAHINDRPRIEMNYIELLFKQGLIGLGFWFALLCVNYAAFSSIRGRLRARALVFLLATIFVYLATATNTFLTGSIGMSVVLISTVVLFVLHREQDAVNASRQDMTAARGRGPLAAEAGG